MILRVLNEQMSKCAPLVSRVHHWPQHSPPWFRYVIMINHYNGTVSNEYSSSYSNPKLNSKSFYGLEYSHKVLLICGGK